MAWPSRRIVVAALVVVVALAVDAAIGLVAPDAADDHATAVGRVSEVAFAVAIAGVAAIIGPLVTRPGGRVLRALAVIACVGAALSVVALVQVAITGKEPPNWLADPAILAALTGMIGVAVAAWRAGAWAPLTATAVGVFFPVLFVGGTFGALVVGLAFAAVAASAARRVDEVPARALA
jgi:hypothetical protein